MLQAYLKNLMRWAFNKRCNVYGFAFLFILDALLCLVVLKKVPYTEIDFVAYMQQIEIYNSGERDYSKIVGQTGPLVYPGGHVLIFKTIYYFTNNGTNIQLAQTIFLAVYLLTLAIVFSVFHKARHPFALAAIVILSKRLHSIYLLRLFNDCFMTLFTAASVRALQSRKLALATLLMSAAITIKMAAVLFLPGLALVCWLLVRWRAAWLAIPFAIPQIYAALPFKDHLLSYFSGAFDLKRKFLYKWTVNWKMFEESDFLSDTFSQRLLLLHAAILVLYTLRKLRAQSQIADRKPMDGKQIAKIMATTNIVGVLCARSLHYQFYSWFYWTLPILMADRMFLLPLWLVLEYAWNTFPATEISSICHVASTAILAVANFS